MDVVAPAPERLSSLLLYYSNKSLPASRIHVESRSRNIMPPPASATPPF
jgi:hypothetical protein